MLVHSSKSENKYLMDKVNLLFKLFKIICQKVTFLNFMVKHVKKTENEGTSFRE